jgi:hypothetical protein
MKTLRWKLGITVVRTGTYGQLRRSTHEEGTTWTPQNENNAESREGVHSVRATMCRNMGCIDI